MFGVGLLITMQDSDFIENDFLSQLKEVIGQNIANENFGVSELAAEIGMSRSNLLRKIKKLTKLSASQFIRQVRLQHAMDILRQTSLNVSEVSYKVGFSSTSYFIKCFREYYGHPPGEVGKREEEELIPEKTKPQRAKYISIAAAGLLVVLAILRFFFTPTPITQEPLEKSIAVLPFKNDSNDSTNLYLINGLMESTLNNLQKIEDLRVISRTSVEKYRTTEKSIPEIAEELKVSYFVEGSGQKINDQILLNIQLIEASTDKHLWAQQYLRESKDIFQLQTEVAKSIADEIQAVITPEEAERISKPPTANLVAYDYFLKGQEFFLGGNRELLEQAIPWFEKAIEEDNEFALAYANLALSYYYIDLFQKEKKYIFQISDYADKALMYDPTLANSLIAKARFYMHNNEFDLAVPYLERALEYNPNADYVIHILSDFYARYSPNTAKYLEYALKGMQLDLSEKDSITLSYTYLHLSNALIQTGFVDEAIRYIDKSLEYPENGYSNYVKAFMLYAKNKDLEETKNLLIKELNKDTTRIDLLQEVGKIFYFMGDYEEAYNYYDRFIKRRNELNMDVYGLEDSKIAVVYSKMGQEEESRKYMEKFKEAADKDVSIYKHLSLAAYYAYHGDTTEAIERVKLFAKEDNVQYWILLFYGMDPMLEPIADSPEFKKAMREIEVKFWSNHQKIKESLREKGLI